MSPKDTDWGAGRVTFWDLDNLDNLDDNIPLLEQIDDLKEDLALVEYPYDVRLDIGWYPEFSRDGSFVVVVAAASGWEKPLYRRSCATFETLRDALREGVVVAQSASQVPRIRADRT